jgi:hypothetical protein
MKNGKKIIKSFIKFIMIGLYIKGTQGLREPTVPLRSLPFTIKLKRLVKEGVLGETIGFP